MSPLLANIAVSALDVDRHNGRATGGNMFTSRIRARRRRYGQANWRIVRYADDFVVLVHGQREDVEGLHDHVADVLEPLGLRLSAAKAQIAYMSEGFDFLGFHIQWKRKCGSNKWHVYTFIDVRPIRSLKIKIRALTKRTSQQDPRAVNQILRGWAS